MKGDRQADAAAIGGNPLWRPWRWGKPVPGAAAVEPLALWRWGLLRCPRCRQTGTYRLAGARIDLRCPCGQALLRLDWRRGRYRWALDCWVCGHTHRGSGQSGGYFPLAWDLDCAKSGALVAVVGERGAVDGRVLAPAAPSAAARPVQPARRFRVVQKADTPL